MRQSFRWFSLFVQSHIRHILTTELQVFQVFMDSLFQSFNQQVSMNNFAELSGCVFSWIEERCKPGDLQVGDCRNLFQNNIHSNILSSLFQDLMSLILRNSGKEGEAAVQEPIDPAYQRM